MTDDISRHRDLQISEHVLRMHRYLAPGAEEGAPVRENMHQSLSVGTEDENNTEKETVVLKNSTLYFTQDWQKLRKSRKTLKF